ncbi:LUD domain protein [Candidatus Bilamarchaeum dharawalense]|uniref:LUD domain protein n=1 Tax=Candidatus Bilamarchaeum dharawalense TaxID=2885759 RepID=A0A5E4LU72_9ARCH|nr:LUD domain protein [Candidatus Bilamarchaeum dharawalense]
MTWILTKESDIMEWNRLADKPIVEKTMAALRNQGMEPYFCENAEEANSKIRSLIPNGAEIMNMSSTTLDMLGISKEIQESGNSVKKKLGSMDRKTQGNEMQKLGAAPEWAIGSVHAVTEKGEVMIVSQSGSQLPAYAYGSNHVIWVVGTQKIVKNLDDGFKRIYEHCLPLESERARKVYGVPSSSVNKILIVNKETKPGRIMVIFVNQVLGF